MDCEKLFACIDELNEEYLRVLEDVCRLESPTEDKARVDAVGRYFADMARARGWQVEVRAVETAGDPICITLNPQAQAAPITLSGHIDTVHPVGLFGPEVVRRDEENMYGPGTLDCKGGVVAAFLAMDALERCGFTARPVKLIVQTDEETNSTTSGKKTLEFMFEKARGAVAFLNAEGITGHTAILARKGILRYQLTVHGKAKHSAGCVDASNAVAEAAHKLLKLEQMKDREGLTCNCGVIHGGTAANTVAEECVFSADIRFANDEQLRQAQAMVQAVAEQSTVAGCTCTLEQVSLRPAMPLTERNVQLLETMNRIYEENGLPRLELKTAMGGSDAAYATQWGIPCVDSIGIAGGRLHSVEEYARLDSLAESAKRMASVACCI